MKLYAILDVKAQLPVVVFQSNTDVEAERRFLSLLTTVENSIFTDNPGDFVLESFGDFSYCSECFTLEVESNAASVVKCGNEYCKSYLDETRIFKLENNKTIQSYIDAQVDFRYQERLKSNGNLIVDSKEVTTNG